MDQLERRVLQFIRRRRLLEPGQRVVAGLSGGPDSLALTLILLDMSQRLRLELQLAHLNHRLRGAESDREERFCRRFAEHRGLPIHVEAVDASAEAEANGQSLEAAARELRYSFLGRVARQVGADAVATGHQADDVAETVLLRMIRGAGVRGLGALPPERPLDGRQPPVRLVRPLLEVRRTDLTQFLDRKQQSYCQDSSNSEVGYTRNRVRHELIPALRRRFPGFSVESLCGLNSAALEMRSLLERLLDERWAKLCRAENGGEVLLGVAALRTAPVALRKAALRRAVKQVAGPPAGRPLGLRAEHYERLAALPARTPGAEVDLPAGVFARREHEVIYVGRREARVHLPERRLEVPGRVDLPEVDMMIRCRLLGEENLGPEEAARRSSGRRVFLRLEALETPLIVRGRRPGDRFHPLGSPGSMRLKEFFINRRVPRHLRDRTPLLLSGDGKMAWVVGSEIGEPFKLRRPQDTPVCLEARAEGGPQGKLVVFSAPPDIA